MTEQDMTDEERFAEQAEESLAFSVAALAVEGKEVTDPVLLQILKDAAYQKITTAEAIELIKQHVLGEPGS